MRKIKQIIVHHSASDLNTTVDDIRDWHVYNNGWSDIGYHYIILGDGSLAKGRPVNKIGAHAKGKNRYSIGICVVGNFENITPQPQQVLKLENLINSLCIEYGIGWNDVSAHRDWGNTLCCGENLYKVLTQMREARSGYA
tara:strand:- start:135 stop:554 length:420 start_codon:yes stop_codon:yes gene_type:complete